LKQRSEENGNNKGWGLSEMESPYACLYYVSLRLTLACMVFRMLFLGLDEFAEGSY
jgi:hypothetical protein